MFGAKLQNGISQLVPTYRVIHSSETDEFYKNKIKKVEQLRIANLCELLVSIINNQTDEATVNNIFCVAFTFPFLEVTKQKTGKHEINFQSKSATFDFIPKKFDKSTIRRVFAQFEITEKSHSFVFKLVEKGDKEFRMVMSELCLLIVLSSIQEKLNIRKIRERFKQITRATSSFFIKRLKLKDDYLKKLKPIIRDHDLRPAFGYVIIETIYNYNKNKKIDIQRQYHFATLIKELFYMKEKEMVGFMDKVFVCLKDNLFAASLEVLFDQDTETEIRSWFSFIWKAYSETNQMKKRFILCYKSLFQSKNLADYALKANKRTMSFFVGLIHRCKAFKCKVDESLLIDGYYALGVQFRNYFYLNQIEANLEFCIRRRQTIPFTYFQDCLNFLNETVRYPERYKSGLNDLRIYHNTSFFPIRNSLAKVQSQIDLLSKINNETVKRNEYIIQFVQTQREFKILPTLNLDESKKLSEPEMSMYMDCSPINLSAFDISNDSNSNVLTDISNNKTIKNEQSEMQIDLDALVRKHSTFPKNTPPENKPPIQCHDLNGIKKDLEENEDALMKTCIDNYLKKRNSTSEDQNLIID